MAYTKNFNEIYDIKKSNLSADEFCREIGMEKSNLIFKKVDVKKFDKSGNPMVDKLGNPETEVKYRFKNRETGSTVAYGSISCIGAAKVLFSKMLQPGADGVCWTGHKMGEDKGEEIEVNF